MVRETSDERGLVVLDDVQRFAGIPWVKQRAHDVDPARLVCQLRLQEAEGREGLLRRCVARGHGTP